MNYCQSITLHMIINLCIIEIKIKGENYNYGKQL